jgi:hypothetical protein
MQERKNTYEKEKNNVLQIPNNKGDRLCRL